MTNSLNQRQRFYIENSPVRGDIVHLDATYQSVLAKKDYPHALQALLGELLVGASLLIGTLKIEGRLSLQLQSQTSDAALNWAMAECDHTGTIRALADFKNHDVWTHCQTSDDAFAQLGDGHQGVLFINIHTVGGSYQGIVERISNNLAECLAHYQKQSAQIPTHISLACNDNRAAGMLIQLLPQSEADKLHDPDLWTRISLLANTLKPAELLTLPADEILYRLYHEEQVVMPDAVPLAFGCTCSQEKSESAILQLGKAEALSALNTQDGALVLDCGFCGASYRFDRSAVTALFT